MTHAPHSGCSYHLSSAIRDDYAQKEGLRHTMRSTWSILFHLVEPFSELVDFKAAAKKLLEAGLPYLS
jgi:hypothetical protein